MTFKKGLILLAFLIALGLAAFGWDFYMRQSWDDHIVSNLPHHFYKTQKDLAGGLQLDPDQVIALPDLYKRPLEITQNGDSYIWVSNENMKLQRSTEYASKDEDALKWFVFKPDDGSAEIRILGSSYVGNAAAGSNGCYSGLMQGNVKITYKGGADGDLITAADTSVYTGPEQYLLCNSRKILDLF